MTILETIAYLEGQSKCFGASMDSEVAWDENGPHVARHWMFATPSKTCEAIYALGGIKLHAEAWEKDPERANVLFKTPAEAVAECASVILSRIGGIDTAALAEKLKP
jgi:hypothetical protein